MHTTGRRGSSITHLGPGASSKCPMWHRRKAGAGSVMPGTPSDEPIAVSIAEAAARLGIHRQTLRAAIERGDLRAVRVGRRWLIPIAAIDELLEGRRARP